MCVYIYIHTYVQYYIYIYISISLSLKIQAREIPQLHHHGPAGRLRGALDVYIYIYIYIYIYSCSLVLLVAMQSYKLIRQFIVCLFFPHRPSWTQRWAPRPPINIPARLWPRRLIYIYLVVCFDSVSIGPDGMRRPRVAWLQVLGGGDKLLAAGITDAREKKMLLRKKDTLECQLPEHQIRVWRAASAAGLQGAGLRERTVFHRHWYHK